MSVLPPRRCHAPWLRHNAVLVAVLSLALVDQTLCAPRALKDTGYLAEAAVGAAAAPTGLVSPPITDELTAPAPAPSSSGIFAGGLPSPSASASAPFKPAQGYVALWSDEFAEGAVSPATWGFDLGNGVDGWGNNEVQSYTKNPDNVFVSNGTLNIVALRAADGSWTSAKLTTYNLAAFHAGMELDGVVYNTVRIEARMRMPQPGAGFWPALWMYPTNSIYGTWSASGEIDIVETKNEMAEITTGIQHGGVNPFNQKIVKETRQPNDVPWSDTFHTYKVTWGLDTMTFSIDGVDVQTVKSRSIDPVNGWYTDNPTTAPKGPNAPFDTPFFINLNLAVGGRFPLNPNDSTPGRAVLAVDYVRVSGKQ